VHAEVTVNGWDAAQPGTISLMDGSPATIPELYLGWGSTFSLRPVDSATGKVLGESEERRADANRDDEVLAGP
jgi:hypothetical protein